MILYFLPASFSSINRIIVLSFSFFSSIKPPISLAIAFSFSSACPKVFSNSIIFLRKIPSSFCKLDTISLSSPASLSSSIIFNFCSFFSTPISFLSLTITPNLSLQIVNFFQSLHQIILGRTSQPFKLLDFVLSIVLFLNQQSTLFFQFLNLFPPLFLPFL
ncbi:hypothetical protein OIU76_016746 [Salix suchowensis]|nr:hypothetical protein OIU76_016746 [Salix suchowensis]